MKFTLQQDKTLDENEIVVKHNGDSKIVEDLYKFLSNQSKASASLELYKDNQQFYLDIDDLVFFETSENIIYAHTINQAYETKYKLYELEALLPDFFMRISKSTICNINYIYSINRNLTATGLIKFKDSQKEVYVSRMYYPKLKLQLEKRLYNEL